MASESSDVKQAHGVECFTLASTAYVPNNILPVIVYRDVLPKPHCEETTSEFLEAHEWEKKGYWGAIGVHHYHPNTHECYGIVTGQATILLGRGQLDDPSQGREVALAPGDVVVLPAGTSHMNPTSTKDFRYVGVYPKGSPQYRYELCDNLDIMNEIREEISRVVYPTMDPVKGENGPLIQLWDDAKRPSAATT
ncbi:hypothetical protein GQ53DRAFT_686983 [Thozetella sp. PMI_491]|nr:hypothetical protein GQ53DRAFT_686983 [Thozetella sp. PMI_491]